ncbi:LamG-like jellyroll fold domain-containing protein [Rubritalea squalenifaciens]|nr:LamG-like jellyroll fold domain-containing protein [Rubritalea squalenifaciens]
MKGFRSLFITTVSFSIPAAFAALDQGLVGYYNFENNGSNYISSGGLADAVSINTPTPGTSGGRAGSAVSLQGADNDHMKINASFGQGNTLGTNFSISAWYKLNDPISSTNSSDRYFVYESTNNYTISYGLRDSGVGNAGLNDGQPYTTGSEYVIADAALPGWHHILQTYELNGTDIVITTYIDGQNTGTLTIASSSFSGNGLNIGAARDSVTTRGFDGLIDEVAIWDRTLNESEITEVYALGMDEQALVDNDTPEVAPTVESFTADPAVIINNGSTTLSWNVTGATSVWISPDVGNVASSGSLSVSPESNTTYHLVALNGNTSSSSAIEVTKVSSASDPVGPFVGTVKTNEAYLLYSPERTERDLRLIVTDANDQVVASQDTVNEAENDYVAKFHISGLAPGTTYHYSILEIVSEDTSYEIAGGTENHQFTTVPLQRTGQLFTAAFVSCANDTTDGVWAEMGNQNIDLLCLSGDTPYVDTGDLSVIRNKHRYFLQQPSLAALGCNVSVVGTWDDHDFGLNNGNGLSTASRKVNTRRGFVEYRAHDQYGNGSGAGIYHKVDMGAMEIFLLDPRWFSQTEASPVDSSQSTCFGNEQWQWILDSIRNSEAPFKVLLQGQIWQDKKNSETDDMYTYYAERDKLLDIIRDEKIPGVVLFGGDIHVARYLMHPQRVGYDLHDFIMSPGHKSVISSLNVYHPSLEWSRERANQFLTLTADTTKNIPELTARYLDKDGVTNLEIVVPYTDLSPKDSNSLSKGLRALWTFDDNYENSSVLGDRLHGAAPNGAKISATGGVRGGALELSNASQQYVDIPRSFLDDNASAYTASAWIKPATLPAHGSSERQFIMESCVNNHTGLPNASTSGYAISVGLRASANSSDKVNLQLHTETLVPKAVGSQQAPGTLAQGGFDTDIDRTLFSDWSLVTVTFDSTELKLYLNGTVVATHALSTAAPIAETGGLVIGGHRNKTGRNFDGLIDEIAIWNRVLTEQEINSLYGNGAPTEIPTHISYQDFDSDGMPDWWEDLFSLNKNSALDAESDYDEDGLTAQQEFGFGTLPYKKDTQSPYRRSSVSMADQVYQSITFQRNTAALDQLELKVQRSMDLGILDSWTSFGTEIVSITPKADGLEEVTVRSTNPISAQQEEFLRILFSPITE